MQYVVDKVAEEAGKDSFDGAEFPVIGMPSLNSMRFVCSDPVIA